MPAIILSSENESHLRQVVEMAEKLGVVVAAANPTQKMPVRKWAGSIVKESAQLLPTEVENLRCSEWDRQF